MAYSKSISFGIKALLQYFKKNQCVIICCKADTCNTVIWFSNGEYRKVSVNIGKIDKLFCCDYLFRSHKSYIVNLNFIMSVDYYYGIIKIQGKINAFVSRNNIFLLKSLRQMMGKE
jgi:DNA-binding LytR/AlgR family response regulator